MKKSWLWLASMLLVLALFLAACGDSDEEEQEQDDTEDTEQQDDTEETEGDSGPAQGGTFTYAIASGPTGPLDVNFYGSSSEAEVNQFVQESLIDYDENLEPIPYIADWESEDNINYTFTFQEGVKWHNGDELTVHDWVLALETLAHPDYTGPRWTNVADIVGAVEYRDGEADSISGINVISDYEIEIEFVEAKVNNLVNLWTYPMNTTVYGDMEVADMEEDALIRNEIIGTGPFTMKNYREGEYYELEKFEDYWQGEPNLDGLVVQVVPNDSVIGALESGQVDFVSIAPRLAEQAGEVEGVSVVTAPGLSYYYVGFRLGYYDHEENVIAGQYDKFQNKLLRQAMWYALDREPWVEEFFGGYGEVINAPVPPAHWIAADPADLNPYEYDPERAMELLDEAGYIDVNDDGWREDPDGNEFTIEFSHYDTGDPAFETRAQAFVQNWQDVGLNATVNMVEVGLYYDTLEESDPTDAPDFELFFGGWSTGVDPDPSGLWTSDALWNYPRFLNEESDQLLADALNVDIVGTDEDEQKANRQQIYTEWQQLINDEAPMLIITALDAVYAKQDRIKGFTIDVNGWNNPSEWYIEAEDQE